MIPPASSVRSPEVAAPRAAPPRPAAPPASTARAAPTDQFEKAGPKYGKEQDGHLVGGDGKAYPPSTNPSAVPPTRPNNGKTPTETILYVNGQGTSPEGHQRDLQTLANGTGQNVVGIYNATEGAKDFLQSGGDKLDLGHNPAVQTLTDTMYGQIQRGEPTRVMGHSQGGLIISRSLEDLTGRLKEDGLSDAQVKEKLSLLTVETLAGAGSRFPDGPKYVHYVNEKDIVPTQFGLGRTDAGFFGPELGADTQPGQNATIIQFNDDTGAHDLSTYLDHYASPDKAASHPDRVEPSKPSFWSTITGPVRDPAGTLEDIAHGAKKLWDSIF